MRKNYRSQLFLWLTAFAPILFFGGCVNELSDIASAKIAPFTPEFAIPLFNDTLRGDDLARERVRKEQLLNFSDGLYYFAFSNTVLSASAEEAVTIPNMTSQFDVQATNNIPASFNTFGTFTLDAGRGVKIFEMLAKGGQMWLNGPCSFGDAFSLQLTFPNVLNGATNQPLRVNTTYTPGSGTLASEPVSLDGYYLDFSTGIQGANQLTFTAAFSFPNGTSNTTTGQVASLGLTVNQLLFRYAQLDFTQAVVLPTIRINLPIAIFDRKFREDNNQITLNDPSIELFAVNSFGVRANAIIDSVRSFTPGDPASTRFLTGRAVDSLKALRLGPGNLVSTRPPVINPFIGPLFTVNQSNSNASSFIDFFKPAPQLVSYLVTAGLVRNAQGRTIVMDTSRVRIRLTAILPLDGSVQRYVLSDTSDFELPDAGDNNTGIDSAAVKLVLYNQYPLNIQGQVYFIDSVGKIIDSLVTRLPNGTIDYQLAEGATPGGAADNFRVPVAAVKRKEREFGISASRYNSIQSKSKKVVFKCAIVSTNGANAQRCRIYNDYFLLLKAGIKVKYKVSI